MLNQSQLTNINLLFPFLSHLSTHCFRTPVDVMLPLNMELFVQNFLIIIFALITISAILPWFLIAVVPVIILYIIILRYYRRAVRDMKRIENVSRSPWFSHISATVQGLSTIRAYNKNKEFADRYSFVCGVVCLSFFAFMRMQQYFKTDL